MDLDRLDRLARSIATAGSRRSMLGLLAAVPVIGGLAGILAPEDAEAKDRRRRRKKRHKKRKSSGKRKKGCTPKSQAKVCAGRCGPVKSRQTCGKTIDCGSCDCSPACEECFTCQGAAGSPGSCVPATAGNPCGDATCESGTLHPQGSCDGSGVCEPAAPVSCAPYTQCDGNACATTCNGDGDCVAGSFCDAGQCVGDLPLGETCADDGQCASGFCVDDVCCDSICNGACQACNLAVPGTCTTEANLTPCGGGNVCCTGTCQECCGNGQCTNPAEPICVVGTCMPCTTSGQCGGGQVCCGGSCFAGICCADAECAPGGDDCVNNECQCGGGSACAGNSPDCCGNPGACTNVDTDPENCGACGAPACDASSPVCWDGNCVCGDVCASGCQFTSVQAAIDGLPAGSTIRLCARTYAPITISKNLTLIGAGDGPNNGSNTLLDAGGSGRVVFVNAGVTASLQGLRITGGAASVSGAGVYNQGHLTMAGCTVTANATTTNAPGGGIYNKVGATLTMTNCTISGNDSEHDGAGIYVSGSTVNLTNCTLSGNDTTIDGAALACNGGSANLNGCTVGPFNTADGGAIFAVNNANVTLVALSVTGNIGTFCGGIYNSSGIVKLENGSTVSGNTPPNCIGAITGDGCT
jgi:hypothetical protein